MKTPIEGKAKIPPTGFAIHSSTAGKLEDVRVSLVMFDLNEKTMASFTNEFNLQR